MRRVIGVGTLALAIGLGACTNHSGPTEVLGIKTQREIPIVVATEPNATPPAVLTPTAIAPTTQPPTNTTTPQTTKAPVAKKSGAVYQLHVDCVYDGHRQSGASFPGGAKLQREDALAGKKMTYEFIYKKDESSDPVVELTENCKIYTTKLREAAEPKLSVLLGCEGETQYSQDPQPASVIQKSWHDLSSMTKPFTHTMKAPKNQYQLSEHVLCTITVKSR